MKYLNVLVVSLCVLGFSHQLWAASLSCQHNARDVGVKLNIHENQVKIDVMVPLGFHYLPLLEAPVSMASLPVLKYQSEQLQMLGDHFSATWSQKDCQVVVKKTKMQTRIECAGQAVSIAPEIHFHTLTVSRIVESTMTESYSTRRFRMMVSREGKYGTDFFSIAIPISESACIDYE